MNVFGDLPAWAVVLGALLAAAALVALNVGWLVQARGMLEQLRRQWEARERQEASGRQSSDSRRPSLASSRQSPGVGEQSTDGEAPRLSGPGD